MTLGLFNYYPERAGVIWLISARLATRKEVENYFDTSQDSDDVANSPKDGGA